MGENLSQEFQPLHNLQNKLLQPIINQNLRMWKCFLDFWRIGVSPSIVKLKARVIPQPQQLSIKKLSRLQNPIQRTLLRSNKNLTEPTKKQNSDQRPALAQNEQNKPKSNYSWKIYH